MGSVPAKASSFSSESCESSSAESDRLPDEILNDQYLLAQKKDQNEKRSWKLSANKSVKRNANLKVTVNNSHIKKLKFSGFSNRIKKRASSNKIKTERMSTKPATMLDLNLFQEEEFKKSKVLRTKKLDSTSSAFDCYYSSFGTKKTQKNSSYETNISQNNSKRSKRKFETVEDEDCVSDHDRSLIESLPSKDYFPFGKLLSSTKRSSQFRVEVSNSTSKSRKRKHRLAFKDEYFISNKESNLFKNDSTKDYHNCKGVLPSTKNAFQISSAKPNSSVDIRKKKWQAFLEDLDWKTLNNQNNSVVEILPSETSELDFRSKESNFENSEDGNSKLKNVGKAKPKIVSDLRLRLSTDLKKAQILLQKVSKEKSRLEKNSKVADVNSEKQSLEDVPKDFQGVSKIDIEKFGNIDDIANQQQGSSFDFLRELPPILLRKMKGKDELYVKKNRKLYVSSKTLRNEVELRKRNKDLPSDKQDSVYENSNLINVPPIYVSQLAKSLKTTDIEFKVKKKPSVDNSRKRKSQTSLEAVDLVSDEVEASVSSEENNSENKNFENSRAETKSENDLSRETDKSGNNLKKLCLDVDVPEKENHLLVGNKDLVSKDTIETLSSKDVSQCAESVSLEDSGINFEESQSFINVRRRNCRRFLEDNSLTSFDQETRIDSRLHSFSDSLGSVDSVTDIKCLFSDVVHSTNIEQEGSKFPEEGAISKKLPDSTQFNFEESQSFSNLPRRKSPDIAEEVCLSSIRPESCVERDLYSSISCKSIDFTPCVESSFLDKIVILEAVSDLKNIESNVINIEDEESEVPKDVMPHLNLRRNSDPSIYQLQFESVKKHCVKNYSDTNVVSEAASNLKNTEPNILNIEGEEFEFPEDVRPHLNLRRNSDPSTYQLQFESVKKPCVKSYSDTDVVSEAASNLKNTEPNVLNIEGEGFEFSEDVLRHLNLRRNSDPSTYQLQLESVKKPCVKSYSDTNVVSKAASHLKNTKPNVLNIKGGDFEFPENVLSRLNLRKNSDPSTLQSQLEPVKTSCVESSIDKNVVLEAASDLRKIEDEESELPEVINLNLSNSSDSSTFQLKFKSIQDETSMIKITFNIDLVESNLNG